MKKTYINPEMILLNIEEEEMISQSPNKVQFGKEIKEDEVIEGEAKGANSVWHDAW